MFLDLITCLDIFVNNSGMKPPPPPPPSDTEESFFGYPRSRLHFHFQIQNTCRYRTEQGALWLEEVRILYIINDIRTFLHKKIVSAFQYNNKTGFLLLILSLCPVSRRYATFSICAPYQIWTRAQVTLKRYIQIRVRLFTTYFTNFWRVFVMRYSQNHVHLPPHFNFPIHFPFDFMHPLYNTCTCIY